MGIARHGSVLIVTGAPGAGKTTTARLVASSWQRSAHVEADRFFAFIRSGHLEPWKAESHEQNVAVMGIVADAAAGYARAGYFTIIDGIVSPRWFYEPVRDSLHRAGCAVAYAVLRPDLETCVARATRREPAPALLPGVVERLWHDFAKLGDLEGHAVDVGRERADEIADAVVRRVRDGTLAV